MKSSKQLGRGRKPWRTMKQMLVTYPATLSAKRRAAFLDRVYRFTGPMDSTSAISMGYLTDNPADDWSDDPGVRARRVAALAAERESQGQGA